MNPIFKINSENPTFLKIMEIVNHENQNVEETYYSTTVFESQEKYKTEMSYVSSVIFNNVKKPIVHTDLAFFMGNTGFFFSNSDGQGVGFSFYFIDARTKNPLLCVLVGKATTNYTYQSIVFNDEVGDFVELSTSSKKVNNVDELISYVSQKAIEDIEKFNRKK